MHCGPPMEAMMSGMVMNGPTPTMLLMLSAMACTKPNARTRPFVSELCLRLGPKDFGQYSRIPSAVALFLAALAQNPGMQQNERAVVSGPDKLQVQPQDAGYRG